MSIYISTIHEIINIWSNDANKSAVFVVCLYLPVLIYNILHLFSHDLSAFHDAEGHKHFLQKTKLFYAEVIFILIFLSAIVGLVGIGQIVIFIPFLDALIRSTGIVLFLTGCILLALLFIVDSRRHKGAILYKTTGFYSFVRHPRYSFLILTAIGLSFLSMSFTGSVITFIFLIPSVLFKLTREEKIILNNDKRYIDYKANVPMVFPSIIKIVRFYFISKKRKKDSLE